MLLQGLNLSPKPGKNNGRTGYSLILQNSNLLKQFLFLNRNNPMVEPFLTPFGWPENSVRKR